MDLKNAARRLAFVMAAAAALVFLVGCPDPPQQAIDAAASAVEQLSLDPDVATYAPDELREARQCLDRLQVEVAAQDARPALFRRYESAAALADETLQAVGKARGAAVASKESVRAEAQKLITDVTDLLPTIQRKAATARRLRGSKLDSAAVAGSFAGVQALLDAAAADLNAGSFASARAKANTAQDDLGELSLTLDQEILLGRGR